MSGKTPGVYRRLHLAIMSGVGRRTHYSKALLGLIETRQRTATTDHVIAYSRALGVAVEHLYGPSLDPLRIAHEWLVAIR
jgi:hypothetical protein